MIDPQQLLSAPPTAALTRWSTTEVITHHLGVGAAGHGSADLRYVHERELVVLPSFATVLAQDAARALVAALPLGTDPSTLIQGEHELVCRRTIDPEGSAHSTAWVESVWDKAGVAVVVVRVDTETSAGEPLAINRYHLLVPGGGGFGGDRGAAPRRLSSPGHAEGGARVLSTVILPHQPAAFRLTGDRTRLHIDPDSARALGFPAPPVAGLCTFGTVLRVALDELAGGDVSRVAQFRARFTGPVYAGDRLEIRADGDGLAWEVEVSDTRRSSPVLGRARLLLQPEAGEPARETRVMSRTGVTART